MSRAALTCVLAAGFACNAPPEVPPATPQEATTRRTRTRQKEMVFGIRVPGMQPADIRETDLVLVGCASDVLLRPDHASPLLWAYEDVYGVGVNEGPCHARLVAFRDGRWGVTPAFDIPSPPPLEPIPVPLPTEMAPFDLAALEAVERAGADPILVESLEWVLRGALPLKGAFGEPFERAEARLLDPHPCPATSDRPDVLVVLSYDDPGGGIPVRVDLVYRSRWDGERCVFAHVMPFQYSARLDLRGDDVQVYVVGCGSWYHVHRAWLSNPADAEGRRHIFGPNPARTNCALRLAEVTGSGVRAGPEVRIPVDAIGAVLEPSDEAFVRPTSAWVDSMDAGDWGQLILPPDVDPP